MPFSGDTHSLPAGSLTSNGTLSDAGTQHNAPLTDISESLTLLKQAADAHLVDTNPHPNYATDSDLAAHVAAADAHPQYITSDELDDSIAAIAGLSSGGFNYYPAAQTNLPRGVTGTSGLTGGSGGTNGTFALAFSGGNFAVNPTGTFTVSGGALTAVTITGPGLYVGASPTAPTVSFAASAGLGGGAAITLTVDYLVAAGEYYWTDHATESNLLTAYYRSGTSPVISSPIVTLARSNYFALFSATESLGLAGTYLDFTRQVYASTTLGNVGASKSGNVFSASGLSFSRAAQQWEPSGNGTFTSYSSGSPAYVADANGAAMGVSVRPARTDVVRYGEDLSQVAHWVRTNLTGVNMIAGNPFGGNLSEIVFDSTAGQKNIRQSQAVLSGVRKTLSAVMMAGTHRYTALSIGGSPFSSGYIVIDWVDETAEVFGTVDDWGFVHLGNGVFDCWVTKTSISAATSSLYLYATDASGNVSTPTVVSGNTAKVISVGFYDGWKTRPHILTPGTGSVSSVATVLTLSASGSFHTDVLEIDNSHDDLIPDSTILSHSTGAESDTVRIVEDGGNYVVEIVASSSVLATITGGSVKQTRTTLTLTINETTKTVAFWMDGELQGTATHASMPTSLDLISIGHDASNVNQFGSVVRSFKHLDGIAQEPELAMPAILKVKYDRNESYLLSDGNGGAYVYAPLAGGDNDDYFQYHFQDRLDAANKCSGLASGGVEHVRRTGAATFTSSIAELEKRDGAIDDSTFIVGSPSANNFLAIVDSATGSSHGWMEAQLERFMLDGQIFVPDTTLRPARKIELWQDAKVWQPASPTTHIANRYGHWTISADGRIYEADWNYVASVTVSSGSYPGMLSTNIAANYTTGEVLEGSADLSDISYVPLVTDHPFAEVHGSTYAARLEVLDGFVRGESSITIQDASGSSANGKIYPQLRNANLSAVSGTRERMVVHSQWRLI